MRQIEGGTVLGVGEGTLNVIEIVTRPAGTNVVFGDGIAARETDAMGFVYVDIVRGAAVQVEATWPGDRMHTELVTVPDAATYDIGALLQA